MTTPRSALAVRLARNRMDLPALAAEATAQLVRDFHVPAGDVRVVYMGRDKARVLIARLRDFRACPKPRDVAILDQADAALRDRHATIVVFAAVDLTGRRQPC